jgi:hypothetical protein
MSFPINLFKGRNRETGTPWPSGLKPEKRTRRPAELTDVARPGEVMAGRIVRIGEKSAGVLVRGREWPLCLTQTSWDAPGHCRESLALNDRVELMLVNREICERAGYRIHYGRQEPGQEHWLSRLPLLPNPDRDFGSGLQEGDVVEVEALDYVNWYILRVRLPDRRIIEVRTNDVHPCSANSTRWTRKLQPGERFEIIVRKADGSWVQRYFEIHPEHACHVSGYRTERVGRERKSAARLSCLKRE